MSYLPVPPQRSNPATFAALADPFLAALPGFGDVMETLALAASEGSFQGTYAGGTTYTKGQTVVSGGVFYVSLQNANTGNTPASSAAWWYSPLNAFLTASSVIAADKGGTGLTGYTTGDLIIASGATTLAKLADVATGNALISGGVGVVPAWGKVGLTTHVTGTLPVANGGTGATSATFCNLTTNVTGTLPVANGGTGQNTYTNGQLLIGNTTGNTLTKATLTQGSGITITNGAGSITIAAAVEMNENASCVFIGTNAGGSATTNTVAIGVEAGDLLQSGATDNILIGYRAGNAITTGDNVVAIGTDAAGAVTTGGTFVAIGPQSLATETGATRSVAIGPSALQTQNLGTGIAGNTAIGFNAGQAVTTGFSNTFLGDQSGTLVTTGSSNTIVGPYQGTTSLTGNVALATGAGTRRFWHDDADAFVSHATTASAANAFLDSATNALRRSTSSLRYKRDVEDLWDDESAKLLKLKPVFYRSKSEADPTEWSYYGVIAEQADAIGLQRLVQYEYAPEDYGEPDENNERWPKPDAQKVPGGFAYDRMTVLLLDLVQRQQARLDAIEARLEALEA